MGRVFRVESKLIWNLEDFLLMNNPPQTIVDTPPPADETARVVVEADSEIRKMLKDEKTSNLQKYKQLVVGDASFWLFAWLELVTLLVGNLRGGLGIFARQKFFRGCFHKCGRGVVIGSNVTIRHPQRIEIGDNVVIDDYVVLDAKSDVPHATLRIEDGTVIGRNSALVCKGGTIHIGKDVNVSVNCTLISESNLYIGDKSLVAGHCYLIAGGNHGTEFSGVPFVDQPRLQKGGIQILANCWVGANVTMLDGVTLGPDTIIGAAALVNRSVPPATIAVGVPAKIISSRAMDTPPPCFAH